MDLSDNRIRTSLELRSLPGYREPIDPAREPLQRILKHYNLSALAQCGLSSCRQWHFEGYVVALESGGLTNVGHVCGKQFGEKFIVEEQAYREKILRPQLLTKLTDGKSRVDQLRQPVAELVERVRTVLSRRKGLKDQFPRLATEINRRANQGHTAVSDVVERTDAEIEDLLAINPRQSREALRYREVPRGRIAGLGFFTADAGGIVFEVLARQSETFLSLSALHKLTTEKLLEWERWLNNLDENIKQGERIAADGEAFFTEANLRLLAAIAQDLKEQKVISTLKPAALEWVPNSASLATAEKAKRLNRRERRAREFRDKTF